MNQDEKSNISEDIGLIENVHAYWRKGMQWLWTVPAPGESMVSAKGRAILRVIYIVFQEFNRDRIPLRSSALTFTVVLSMVPLLALGTAVLKGLGAGGQMREAAYSFIEQLEEPADEVIKESDGQITVEESKIAAPEKGDGQTELQESDIDNANLTGHLRKAVDQVFEYVDKTNFAALGAFGIIGLLLAVLSVLGSIEEAMNAIWQASRDRPISRKIIDYLALMILLPITINLALATEATLKSPTLFAQFQDFLPLEWLAALLLNILPLIIVVGACALFYKFLPNTRVRIFPAFVGGIVGGGGWLIVQSLYVDLQIGVARYNAIYGSFATLPLFLLWIYVGWLVFLLGAETSFAVQEWRGYIRKEVRLLPSMRLAIAYSILDLALRDYHARTVTSFQNLLNQIRQPAGFIRIVLNELVDGGLLYRVEGKNEGYVPASPEEGIKPAEIVDLIFGRDVSDLPTSCLAEEALQGARLALADKRITGACEL